MNLRKLFIGIDPGKNGGIAWILDQVGLCSMPDSMRDLYDTLWLRRPLEGRPCFALVERVQGYIGGAHPGSAMFKFGQSYGAILMALTSLRIPYDTVTPQRWQKTLGIPPRKSTESKVDHKRKIKAKAQMLFPSEHITLKTCDALLIAEYCRRTRGENV